MKTNSILVVNKPACYTSRDIVNIIGKELKTKKIGHTGTLDPLASGVLVLCINRYTKLVEMLTSLDKEYIAQIKLGIKTDTLDITGNVLEEKDCQVTEEEIKKVFASFIGPYKMEVPLYSAIKVKGKKLYEYARNNEEVNIPIKNVYIYELELLEFKDDMITFRAKVQKGTYIRSLIRDICTSLNTIGTMNNLIRTKQGKFHIDNSYTLEDIKNKKYQLLTIKDTLDFPIYQLDDLEIKKVKNGAKIFLNQKAEYILLMYQNQEIAIYQKENELYKPYILLDINC